MADLHKIIASVKDALGSGASSNNSHADVSASSIPVSPSAVRAELASTFARELEQVGGRFLGILTPAQVASRIVALASEIGARSAAIGHGISIDMEAVGEALERADVRLVRVLPVADTERATMRSRLADAELGIVEADYAIASTGTIAVSSTANRPSALTLLPPKNLVIVQIDRVMANLAALISQMGAEAIAARRMTLITGPSRTADIEKRIVMGVHGPKSLDAIAVWPHND